MPLFQSTIDIPQWPTPHHRQPHHDSAAVEDEEEIHDLHAEALTTREALEEVAGEDAVRDKGKDGVEATHRERTNLLLSECLSTQTYQTRAFPVIV